MSLFRSQILQDATWHLVVTFPSSLPLSLLGSMLVRNILPSVRVHCHPMSLRLHNPNKNYGCCLLTNLIELGFTSLKLLPFPMLSLFWFGKFVSVHNHSSHLQFTIPLLQGRISAWIMCIFLNCTMLFSFHLQLGMEGRLLDLMASTVSCRGS